jgi:hypothetical protein
MESQISTDMLSKINNFEELLDYIIKYQDVEICKFIDNLLLINKNSNYDQNNNEDSNTNNNKNLKECQEINKPSIFNNLSCYSNKINLSNFIFEFFQILDYREKIFEKVISKKKVLSVINCCLDLFKSYQEKNLLIKYTGQRDLSLSDPSVKVIFSKILESFLRINLKFLKNYIEIFDLKLFLFENEAINLVCYINKLISKKDLKKTDNILKLIEFFLSYIKEENILLTSEFGKLVDLNGIFEISIYEKKLFNITKRVLRIVPEKFEELINFYLERYETKHASDIAMENEFKHLVRPELIEKIRFQANYKSMNFHYSRYWNYEIDIEQLLELFWDQTEIVSSMVNRFCKDKLFYESYYILKAYDFNLNVINLDENSQNIMKKFLSDACKKSPKLLSVNYKNETKLNSSFLKYFADNKYVNIYIEDFYGPLNNTSLKIEIPFNKLFFIDNLNGLLNIMEIISKEAKQLHGIDFEWKPVSSSIDSNNGAALMQIASNSYVILFDLIKMKKDELLKEKFFDTFRTITFLANGMKSDLNNIPYDFKNFFLKCKIIDIQDVYKQKFSLVCPNLSQVCKEFLNVDLCKQEQMSNWERRPLRKRQMHYAALDAFVLIKIYDKFSK